MIKSILRGIVIGIANIVPGVSGGTMMVSMGIYDKLIHCITHLFSEFKKNVLYLLPIAVGMGIGIVSGALALSEMYAIIPFQTSLLFVGLVVGSLPIIWKNVKGKTIRPGHIIACAIFFAVVLIFALMGEQEENTAELVFSYANMAKLVIVGVVAAATMIIPGVSGSMVLTLLGFHKPVMDAISAFFKSLFAWDMDGILQGIGVLAPFGVGVVIGIFAVAKLIEIVFGKYPLYAYWSIIGLILASPVAIINAIKCPVIGLLEISTGVLAMAVGFVIAMKLGD
jgi:putative membrane protein